MYQIRRYFSDDYESEVIETGLTLAEAQAHCQDLETSSRTATSDAAVRLTAERGPWFDGYEEEGT
jgi:hypothetical protein